jgi:hypothetical protein
MKKFWISLGTVLSVVLIFSACLFTSCLKDKNPVVKNGTIIEPCKNKICYNDGTCIDGTCICVAGYSGDSCKSTWNSFYVGSYEANDQCSIGNNYNVQVTPVINVPNGIILNGISKFCTDVNLSGTINPDKLSITFPAQQFCNTLYVSGTGTQTADGKYINCWITSRDSVAHKTSQCSIVLRKL